MEHEKPSTTVPPTLPESAPDSAHVTPAQRVGGCALACVCGAAIWAAAFLLSKGSDSTVTQERALVAATEAVWIVPALLVLTLGRLARLSWVTTVMPLAGLVLCAAFYKATTLTGRGDDTMLGEFALGTGALIAGVWLVIAGIRHLQASR